METPLDTNQYTAEELELIDKYRSKTEIEHVLTRPSTWIGSIFNEIVKYNLFVPSKNQIVEFPKVGHNDGLLKLVDEVLSNAVDEHRRKNTKFQITEIEVSINSDGRCVIADNGGIPVLKHPISKLWLPEMLFGVLRTSENFDDTKERNVVGTNGLGAKLTNIFSKAFSVETADCKNHIKINWFENMSNVEVVLIEPSTQHFTRFEFNLDIERFEMTEIPGSTIRIIQKRCIDAAAANPGLKINFSSDAFEGVLTSTWLFNSFKEYVNLYLDENQRKNSIEYVSTNKREMVVVLPHIGFDVAFINGALCNKGTHIDKIEKQVVEKILQILKDKDIELITEKDILSKISIFLSASVVNPFYKSQTKEELSSKIDKQILNLSKEFLTKLEDCEIVQQLIDYYKIKYEAEAKKELRKLNIAIKTTKTKKLISCSSRTNSTDNELWLFEGTSAAGGFREHRDPMNQAAYLLRGKVRNTFTLSKNDIFENVELREIIATLGLQFGDPAGNVRNCMFKKIMICSDQDFDGHHICSLLIAFFAKHFPELIRAGYVYRALSPIIIARKKGSEERLFYTMADYELEIPSLKGYSIKYCKGLGGLNDAHYGQMLNQQKLIKFTINDALDLQTITVWFQKASDQRKLMLLETSSDDE